MRRWDMGYSSKLESIVGVRSKVSERNYVSRGWKLMSGLVASKCSYFVRVLVLKEAEKVQFLSWKKEITKKNR